MDSGKSFDLERHPGFARLALNPNLNAYHWADIERSAAEILTALESAKAKAVIVDLSSLDYLGSAQLTLLVRVWKAIKAGGGRMVVLVTAPVVREVLNTAGLSSLWEFSDSLAGAYAALGLQTNGRSRMSLLLPIIGIVALAASGVSMFKAGSLEPRIALFVQMGFSAVALAAGLWLIMRSSGMRRGLGIGMVLVSVVLTVMAVLRAVPGKPAASAEQSEEKKSEEAEPETSDAAKAGADKADAEKGAAKKIDVAPAAAVEGAVEKNPDE